MPSFRGKIQNAQCLIAVHVCPPQLYTDGEKQIEGGEGFRALIDTGAQRTCISVQVASSLHLSPESKTHMRSATGKVAVNLYQVGVFIPIEKRAPVGVVDGKINYQTQSSLFGSLNALVMEFNAFGDFDVIIGMDMLSHCNLFVAHGEFFISY